MTSNGYLWRLVWNEIQSVGAPGAPHRAVGALRLGDLSGVFERWRASSARLLVRGPRCGSVPWALDSTWPSQSRRVLSCFPLLDATARAGHPPGLVRNFFHFVHKKRYVSLHYFKMMKIQL